MSDEIATAPLSRRSLLGGGAALGVGLAGLGVQDAAAQPTSRSGSSSGSVRSAVRFLQGVTDAYHSTGFRLAQSYYDDSGLRDTAFVYDNALAIIALLAGGDTGRARAIGDALLWVQNNDEEFNDGRVRQAYHANTLTKVDPRTGRTVANYVGDPFWFIHSAVGDLSWAGIALAQLARRTRSASYLTGAKRIAQWIFDNTRSTSGLGGYTFGTRPDLQGFKSAEHNIDVYAFFRMIARLTGRGAWLTRADHAWEFVTRLWNAEDGFFWTGSNDGSTINKSPTQLPLDVQTWSWLGARRQRYAAALDWAATNLATTDTPQRTNSALTGNYKVSGVAFGSGSLLADTESTNPVNGGPDTGAVWFEGNAQLALALRDRGQRGDADAADDLLAAIRSAQGRLGAGQTFNSKVIPGGIVAASSPMDTGFGFGYYQHLHVGATSWYVMAGTGTNPYRFL
jgi:hypothetical protein